MPTRTLETDYLVVGCGAAGMAFADALITDSDAQVLMAARERLNGVLNGVGPSQHFDILIDRL